MIMPSIRKKAGHNGRVVKTGFLVSVDYWRPVRGVLTPSQSGRQLGIDQEIHYETMTTA